MTQQSTDFVRRSVTVSAPIERAFAVFTGDLASWWPREYTWSKQGMEAAYVDSERGRWIERDSQGNEILWGELLTWDPPNRIVLSWLISPQRTIETDPARASEIEIRFVSEGSSTSRVELEHRKFSRHGEGWEAMRAGMDSDQGWSWILERYAAAV